MRTTRVLGALAVVPAALMAWQGYMGTLGITQSALQSQAERSLRNYGTDVTLPYLGTKTMQAAKGLSEQDRAAAVKEIAAAVKGIVMSKPFMDAHAAYIQKNNKAVDHGIKVQSQEEKMKAMMAGGEAAINDAEKQMAIQMAQILMQLPAAQLKPLFDSDLSDWERKSKSANAKSRAEGTKLYTRAKAIEPLLASDPEKFKKDYVALKSFSMGGPDNAAELQAGGNKQQQEEEQNNWNKYNLKSVLKAKLAAVVNEAASVDFAAQTAPQGGKLKFTNPAYERKSSVWKAMYRAGKAPTAALSEFCKAWMKEL